jgi:hypothetical protein
MGLSGVLDGFRVFEALKLSVGGMLIRLPAEPSLGQEVRVDVPLGSDTFRSAARVVFLGPDLDGGRASAETFRVGLEFLSPLPSEQAVLERYVAGLKATRP